MPESVESHSETTYDSAVARLRAYQANIAEAGREREAALDAIPGFREAFDKAVQKARAVPRPKGVDHFPVSLPEFEPQMSDIYAEFDRRLREQEAERSDVIAAFAALDEADIRRLFALPRRPLDGKTIEFHVSARMLMLAGNRNAVVPLIERLQAEVQYDRPPGGNRFLNFVGDLVIRDLIRSGQEAHRVLERTMTLRALGRLGDRRAEPAIRPFLQDPDEKIRGAAQKALADLQAPS